MSLPLDGLRVVTAAEQYPGPYATMVLADLGADVVIVERPGTGDPTRAFPAFHAALNRGKRSVALDLKTDEGRRGLGHLLSTADLFLEGFRPGTMARLGFGPEQVRAINPATVYVSISGFGQSGPHRLRPAHDISYQAAAGLLADAGTEPPASDLALGDLSSAMFALVGALAALRQRDRTGTAAHVDVSMTDGLVSWLTAQLVPAANGHPAPALGSAEPAYGLFRCADERRLSLSVAYEDWFWTPLCDVLGLGDVRDLARPERLARRDELEQRIRETLLTRPRDVWGAALDAADVAWAPVLDLGEVLEDEHFRARRLFTEAPYRDGAGFRYVAQPLVFDGDRPGPVAGVPEVGEANADLLPPLP